MKVTHKDIAMKTLLPVLVIFEHQATVMALLGGGVNVGF
jgi:hypothetical protein